MSKVSIQFSDHQHVNGCSCYMGLLPSKPSISVPGSDLSDLRVSVIIPALNEEQLVGRAVHRCAVLEASPCVFCNSEVDTRDAFSAKGFEAVHSVLVVDGGSTDRTVERARAAGAQARTSVPVRSARFPLRPCRQHYI